jgi:sensor histidine kinase regulating citrate/malate metabolism
MNLSNSNQWQRGAANAGMSSPPASREAADGREAGSSAVKFTARNQSEDELHWEVILVEAQVDSALDGILVVDSHGEIIHQNQRHRALWKIPAHIAENYTEQLKFFMKQTKHPDEFLKKVSYLYTHPDEVVRDEVELVDGTILDRYSSPVRNKAGKYYGRIWIFRDITERRKLEEQLRQSQKIVSI